MANGYSVVIQCVLHTFSFWARWVHHARTVMYRRTNLEYIVQNTDERVAILNQFVGVLSPSTHVGRLRTFGTPGTCVTCISSPRLWSGSSGWGSAAARRYLVRKKERFACKPLMIDALIPGQWLFIALVQWKKNKFTTRNIARKTDWVERHIYQSLKLAFSGNPFWQLTADCRWAHQLTYIYSYDFSIWAH